LKNSHPIEVEVENAKDVDSIFDTISYAKGASIIRMLVHFIGFDNFKLSVQNYLKKFSYANTFTRDLWQEFQNFYEASANYKQISVPVLMKSWTEVVGYPVVSSSISSGKLHLCQKRFLRDGSLSDSESIWSIPIRIHFLDDDSKLVAQYTVVLDKSKKE
jgi:aminopeptidase N